MPNLDPKTPLQNIVEKKIRENPTLKDDEIAKLAFAEMENTAADKWEGKNPSQSYVSKLKGRMEMRTASGPDIKIEVHEGETLEPKIDPAETEPKTDSETQPTGDDLQAQDDGVLIIPGFEETNPPPTPDTGGSPPDEHLKQVNAMLESFDLKNLLKTASEIIADRTQFKKFELSDKEADRLSTALNKVLIKYEDRFFIFLNKYGEEMALLVIVCIIFAPKIMDYQKTKGDKK